MRVLVIGAGIIGLCSAKLLLDAGHQVEIWAKDMPEDTTSATAGAFWYPYLANPKEKIITWSKYTREYLSRDVMIDKASGTREIMLTEYLDQPTPDPWWREIIEDFSRPAANELPQGYLDGYRFKTFLMDTSKYLPWLVEQISKSGAEITQKEVQSFDEAFETHEVIVNCTGLASRKLCKDTGVYPIRGQVLFVEPANSNQIVCDDSGHNNLAYIVPRNQDVILGGTAQENDWRLEVDPEDSKEILRKAGELSPAFKDAKLVNEKVGLRPARAEVRLELETLGDKHLIHNYGHGGAGFTLSWGCASEVVKLAEALK